MASPIYSMKIAIEEPTSVPIFSLHDKAKVTAPNYQILPTETDLNTPNEDCIASNSSQKYEDFAVSALVENEDQTDTDVIAHLDVLKQLLATAYSEAELSLVVQCFGGTLVLSLSGCVESPSMVDGALLNKFARLSMMESCGCRLPTPNAPTVLEPPIKPKVFRCNFEGLNLLVGHDLLLLSNANFLTSLHLWDETAVTSFTWMDAWLGNVIVSLPEVAVCYHEKGAVNGYDFLKTSEIPSEKGISLFDGSVLHHGVQVLNVRN